MRKSRVKAKLSRDEPVLVTTLHFVDPSVFELASLMGFDCIWMDLEHHTYSLETAATLMRAARVGTCDIVARPAKGEYMRMGRLFEAGANGIMYPRCDDADEAAEVVRWAKFAPEGARGIDGGNPDMPYCSMPIADYIVRANRETFVVIQLESPEAVERAGEIAAVDGVDVLMFGPGDFSILSGVAGQWDHALLKDARHQIAAAAKANGKHWGTIGFTPNDARTLIDMGARFVCHGSDMTTVKAGLEAIQRDFSPIGFSFDNQLL